MFKTLSHQSRYFILIWSNSEIDLKFEVSFGFFSKTGLASETDQSISEILRLESITQDLTRHFNSQVAFPPFSEQTLSRSEAELSNVVFLRSNKNRFSIWINKLTSLELIKTHFGIQVFSILVG